MESSSGFSRVVLCHLDAAYNLARWLTGTEHDAEDAVQEACLRAHKAFPRFQGDDARAWLLKIVRNACYTLLEKRRGERLRLKEFDDDQELIDVSVDPSRALLRAADAQRVREGIASLDPEYREIIILREMEGMSYKEVAAVADVPIGTVMSRLSRGRQKLAEKLTEYKQTERTSG